MRTEYMNEPPRFDGWAPKGYESRLMRCKVLPYLKKASRRRFLGRGVGGGLPCHKDLPSRTSSQKPARFSTRFSYHYYGANSARCGKVMPTAMTTQDAALSREWLTGTDRIESFYAGLRDQFLPGRPLWVTETADAACGGKPMGFNIYR